MFRYNPKNPKQRKYLEDYNRMHAFWREYNKHSDNPELQKKLMDDYLKQGGILEMAYI